MNRVYRRIAYRVSRRRNPPPLARTARCAAPGPAAILLALALTAGAAWLLGGYGAVISATLYVSDRAAVGFRA